MRLHLTSLTVTGRQGHFRFRRLISCKGAELGHVVLLNANRKPYMGSQMHASHTCYNPGPCIALQVKVVK